MTLSSGTAGRTQGRTYTYRGVTMKRTTYAPYTCGSCQVTGVIYTIPYYNTVRYLYLWFVSGDRRARDLHHVIHNDDGNGVQPQAAPGAAVRT